MLGLLGLHIINERVIVFGIVWKVIAAGRCGSELRSHFREPSCTTSDGLRFHLGFNREIGRAQFDHVRLYRPTARGDEVI
jgi:hypothetical protein